MQNRTSHWNQLKEYGGTGLLTLMFYFYRLGGRWFCKFILYFIVAWYWLFAQSARQASLVYLRQLHVFAGKTSPFISKPSLVQSYWHFIQFGESILDKMEAWLGYVPDRNLQLFGHQYFQQTYKKGALIVVSHFGNIELLRAIKSEHPQQFNVLVYQKHASQFNTFLKKLNSRTDINLISVDELGLETAILLEEKMQQGEWVIVAADRVPVDSDRLQQLDFLGRAANWPQGAWLLASLLKVPVLAVFCYKTQANYEVHIHKMTESVHFPRKFRLQAMQNVMQQYVILLEQHCLKAPYQWFNFYQFWKN